MTCRVIVACSRKCLGVVLLAFLSLGLVTCTNTPASAPAAPPIYLDDIAYPDDGFALSTAFASEPTCNGLTLVRHSGSTDKAKLSVLSGSHWFVLYSCNDFGCGGRVSMSDAKAIRAEATLTGKSDEAARQMCVIVKGRGGKVL